MVKKKMAKKVLEENNCNSNMCSGHQVVSIKLASMAFILFLITVWPALMNLVQRIHWGWFLGATVLFGLGFFGKNCCKGN